VVLDFGVVFDPVVVGYLSGAIFCGFCFFLIFLILFGFLCLLRDRIIVQLDQFGNGLGCRFQEIDCIVDLILRLYSLKVPPDCILPESKSMELELVIDNILEMFLDHVEMSQPHRKHAVPPATPTHLNLKPHRLQLQDCGLAAFPHEQLIEFLGPVDPAGPQSILDALVVEIAIGEVQLAGRLERVSGLEGQVQVLLDAGLRQVQLDQRGRLLQGRVYQGQAQARLVLLQVVLGHYVQTPDLDQGMHGLLVRQFVLHCLLVDLGEELVDLGLPCLVEEF
jgi:hypothetical protein